MADRPDNGLSTPLESAHTPAMDRLVSLGRLMRVQTVPPGVEPSSDAALPALMGLPDSVTACGRAPLEALARGIALDPDQWVLRCNFVSVSESGIVTHTALPDFAPEDSFELASALASQITIDSVTLHPALAAAHLVTIRGYDYVPDFQAPWRLAGLRPDSMHGLPLLHQWQRESSRVLSGHHVNRRRMSHGLPPANAVVLWSAGRFAGLSVNADGVVVAGTDLPLGIAMSVGMRTVRPVGATGTCHTDYSAKAKAALTLLADGTDNVIVHIEACDEASHRRDRYAKIKAIEDIDRLVATPILQYVTGRSDVAMLLLPDHPTYVSDGCHGAEPVPAAYWYPGIEPDSRSHMSERSAAECRLVQSSDLSLNLR